MTEKDSSISEPIYTLAIVSKLSGIPTHSIRQYIDKGLILPYTTEKNRHLFSEIDVVRLKCIKKMISGGLNIAGIKAIYAMIPCWEIRNCPVESRESCDAYHADFAPCWESSNKGKLCINEDCRFCDVYKLPSNCQSSKGIIKQLLERNKESDS